MVDPGCGSRSGVWSHQRGWYGAGGVNTDPGPADATQITRGSAAQVRNLFPVTADERGAGPVGQPPSYARVYVPVSASLVRMRTGWVSFYDDHYHRVIRLVMHYGASLQDAQDAADEAFTDSWTMLQNDPDKWLSIPGKPAWIRAVALRKYWRPPGPRHRPQVAAAAEIPDLAAPGPGPGEITIETQMVLAALRTLDEQALVVMAFHLDDFTTADIAAALDITEQRVRDINKKARTALKRVLTEHMSSGGSEER